MRHEIRRTSMVLAIALTAIILLPTIVSAETQAQVTETVSIAPYEDNNDELVNIANETIELNIDTWDPLPQGIFVGGTVQESKMRLKEVGVADDNWLLLATVMKFDQAYLSNGASTFIIRTPAYIPSDESALPLQADFWMYNLASATDYSIEADPIDSRPNVITSSRFVAYNSDMANFFLHAVNSSIPVWVDMSHESWVSGNRLYARVVAPVIADQLYLFAVCLSYPVGTPFDIFVHGGDLCSDNITSSRVAYSWLTAPDLVVWRNYPVSVDLGWSFVFQVGLGNTAISYDRWYEYNDQIIWNKWVRVNSTNASGAFTFIFEFRNNYTADLVYNLSVVAKGPPPARVNTTLLNPDYWHSKHAKGVIVAANPVNTTLAAWTVDSSYWLVLAITLEIKNATRMQFLASYEADAPYDTILHHNYFTVRYDGPGEDWGFIHRQTAFFAPYCTATIGATYYNSSTLPEERNHISFWTLVGWYFSRDWVDRIGGTLITVGGVLISLGGIGAAFGYPIVAVGLSWLITMHWAAIVHHALGNLLQMIIDGLQWLGDWLWKIGQWIWKAFTWFVDQLVYYGAVLLGLLIIGVSIVLFIYPIKWEIGILSSFESLARGDTERAKKQLGEVSSSVRGVGSTVTGGRI